MCGADARLLPQFLLCTELFVRGLHLLPVSDPGGRHHKGLENARSFSPLDFAFHRTCSGFAFADGTGYFIDEQGRGKFCGQQNAVHKSETRRSALFTVRNGADADWLICGLMRLGKTRAEASGCGGFGSEPLSDNPVCAERISVCERKNSDSLPVARMFEFCACV